MNETSRVVKRAMRMSAVVLLVSTVLFSLSGVANASRVKTLRNSRATVPKTTAVALPADTFVCAADTAFARLIRFSGYEKTLRSRKETFFLTNRTADTLRRAAIHIDYFDMQGRLLHSAPRSLGEDVLPGVTRRFDLPSWDTQCTFYYHRSPRPRKSAIPYKVKILADTLFFSRP